MSASRFTRVVHPMRIRVPVLYALCVLVVVVPSVAPEKGHASVVVNTWPTTFVGGASTPTGKDGWIVTANGAVSTISGLQDNNYGGAEGKSLARPIAGLAATPTGKGYWYRGG